MITFLSDFGLTDPFVGVCHAVIAQIAPGVPVVDLTHAIRPQDVRQGARILADCVPYAGPAVHLAVVDPGVGTQRQGVVLRAGREPVLFVGPDNGLLTLATERLGGVQEAWVLAAEAYRLPRVSRTFHGRDVFAPAAAYLAAGVPPDELGPPVSPAMLVTFPPRFPHGGDGWLDTEVEDVDRFGNLQLAARLSDLVRSGLDEAQRLRATVAGRELDLARAATFGEVPPGTLALIEDSFGWLAIVEHGGSAAARLGADVGTPVRLTAAR